MNTNFISQDLLNHFSYDPLTYDLLCQVDFTEMEDKYSYILLSQFSTEEWTLLQNILSSGVYQKYIDAHNLAIRSCAKEIDEIVDLVTNFVGEEH